MNAKKIMGAVLVALLAAALFVGAGAAVTDTDFGTVFIGQDESTAEDGTYINGAYKVTIKDGVVSGDNVEGTYTSAAKNTIYVSKPTAKYDVVGTIKTVSSGDVKYIIANGGNIYLNSLVSFGAVAAANGVEIDGFLVTFPSGKVTTVEQIDYTTGENPYVSTGVYKIQAIFNKTDFIDGFNSAALIDANAFTFTIVDESDATISASVDTVYSGDYVTFTIKGTIGATYKLALKGFVKDGEPVIQLNGPTTVDEKQVYTFAMPNSGVADFQFKVDTTDKTASVELQDKDSEEIATVEVTVSKPVLTANVGASSYFVGDEIEISGTSTSGAKLIFTIEGTNFKETLLTMNDDTFGKTWEADLVTKDVTELGEPNGKKLDVGTYTINLYEADKAVVNSQSAFKTEITDKKVKPVKTVVVVLKQPFISIIEAPEVIVQKTEADFVIGAEATTGIRYYIFGTNFFNASLLVEGPDKDTTNQFSFTLKKDFTEGMDAGQYFMVIQHPMYDGKFNIRAFDNEFFLNTSGEAVDGTGFLFDVNARQTANAAQALCDALDTQNIDDMYVKYSFFVVGEDESYSISDIPSEITKGTTLVISGVDTANAENTVVVEMMSTAFAAVPKDTVGSAAFIAVTTEVAEDGTWEVTLDTSDLNIDEYSLSVVINDVTKKNVKVNVIEAAPVNPDTPDTPDVPDTPDTPDTPDAPKTPGFGALAALAGLGAVAVLLLRRE